MQKLGGSTARQPDLVGHGNIPYRGRHAQLMHGGWPWGRTLFRELRSFLIREFIHFQEFGCFHEFYKICKIQVPGSAIAARELAATQLSQGEKIVLYTVSFAYSLLSLVVVVFPLLSY